MGELITLRRGDVVWATLGPTRGHEQGGRRPVLILSPEVYNTRTKLAVMCPITSQVKGFPFEVVISTKKTKEIRYEKKSSFSQLLNVQN